jgi:hypothetical protein
MTLWGRNDNCWFNCFIPALLSVINNDLFSSIIFIDFTYSWEFVTMVGSSGKYGEYNSLRRDIPSEIYLFNIIIYLLI